MYLKGVGVNEDPQKAFKLISNVAQQGNSDAQFTLGLMYYHGEGVGKDKKAATFWLKKSTQQGNVQAIEILNELKE